MDWNMVWTTLGGMAAIMTLFSGLFFWFMSRIENRLDAHITETSNHFDSVNARIDQMGQRIDQMGQRIDTTQGIIMRMLNDQGK